VRDYLRRTVYGDDLDTAIDQERKAGTLDVVGELIYVEAEVKGFKRDSVTLRWSAYNAANAKRVKLGDLGSDLLGSKRELQAPTDRSVQVFWLSPLLDRSRKYFVRVQAEDSSRVILAVADSRPFRGLRPPPPS
jgi:hypothetical protein